MASLCTVSGTVFDPSEVAVENAKVTWSADAFEHGGQLQVPDPVSVFSDGNGDWSLDIVETQSIGLAPYRVTIEHPDFDAPVIYNGIQVLNQASCDFNDLIPGGVAPVFPGTSFTQVYLIDFTTQPTHDFKVSGAVVLTPTIGNAATWTPVNAGTATNLDISASGLRVGMPAGGTEQWNAATATSPAVRATISALIGSYGIEDWLAFQTYIDPSLHPLYAGNAFQLMAINPATLPGGNSARIYQGKNTTFPSGFKVVNGGSTSEGWSQGFGLGSAADVLQMQWRGLYGEVSGGEVASWGGSFPTPSIPPQNRGQSFVQRPDNTMNCDGSTDTVAFSGENSGAAPAFDAVFRQFSMWKREVVIL